MPGEGKRAVVYNSPSFHLTGVAMFSCALMSLGFDVTAVIKVHLQRSSASAGVSKSSHALSIAAIRAVHVCTRTRVFPLPSATEFSVVLV